VLRVRARAAPQEQDRLEEVRGRQLAWAEQLKSQNDKLANVKLPKPQKEAASIK
jgi:hypothetical protein